MQFQSLLYSFKLRSSKIFKTSLAKAEQKKGRCSNISFMPFPMQILHPSLLLMLILFAWDANRLWSIIRKAAVLQSLRECVCSKGVLLLLLLVILLVLHVSLTKIRHTDPPELVLATFCICGTGALARRMILHGNLINYFLTYNALVGWNLLYNTCSCYPQSLCLLLIITPIPAIATGLLSLHSSLVNVIEPPFKKSIAHFCWIKISSLFLT